MTKIITFRLALDGKYKSVKPHLAHSSRFLPLGEYLFSIPVTKVRLVFLLVHQDGIFVVCSQFSFIFNTFYTLIKSY